MFWKMFGYRCRLDPAPILMPPIWSRKFFLLIVANLFLLNNHFYIVNCTTEDHLTSLKLDPLIKRVLTTNSLNNNAGESRFDLMIQPTVGYNDQVEVINNNRQTIVQSTINKGIGNDTNFIPNSHQYPSSYYWIVQDVNNQNRPQINLTTTTNPLNGWNVVTPTIPTPFSLSKTTTTTIKPYPAYAVYDSPLALTMDQDLQRTSASTISASIIGPQNTHNIHNRHNHYNYNSYNNPNNETTNKYWPSDNFHANNENDETMGIDNEENNGTNGNEDTNIEEEDETETDSEPLTLDDNLPPTNNHFGVTTGSTSSGLASMNHQNRILAPQSAIEQFINNNKKLSLTNTHQQMATTRDELGMDYELNDILRTMQLNSNNPTNPLHSPSNHINDDTGNKEDLEQINETNQINVFTPSMTNETIAKLKLNNKDVYYMRPSSAIFLDEHRTALNGTGQLLALSANQPAATFLSTIKTNNPKTVGNKNGNKGKKSKKLQIVYIKVSANLFSNFGIIFFF